MKKALFTILLAILFCQLGYSVEIIITDKEKIDIEEHPKEYPVEDRSVKSVECYLSRSENTVEVEYSGIGAPIVYIFDANGNILSYNPATGTSGNIIINLPQEEGRYTLLIQSQTYCGEGVFYIH